MADENNGVKDELKKVVAKWNNLTLVDYMTPEEMETIMGRAVQKLSDFYAPMLQKIDSKYYIDFIRFTETGDASPEFMAYLDDEKNTGAQEAVHMVMQKQAEVFHELAKALREGAPKKGIASLEQRMREMLKRIFHR